ncbi:maleylacetate reductase (plasmid) [Azospirillum oryzae]|uniref:Maleylacetate reductase n=1 Tax=Azospirillum oryzae TaxID=286727 RepID=A0A6N1AT86_9PROT|nr:maleylacetate reductase [Azospirillum oryzae]KAA0585414.1 maleylacetate reductase [Azospirillum oryzae]QKS54569.1 maleylacetate reductase [Azospirillum oryzae]GLR77435.1 maleylacetate reductase [Azospirillum oryzae]
MFDFTYIAQPSRVIFAVGSLNSIRQEVEMLGCKRAIVLCTPPQRQQAESVAALLGEASAGVYDGAEMHVPIEVARKAREHAKAVGADCAVAVGGGSTIGLGKAIALESSIPILAVPTTYAGSEMTPVYGITEAGVKRTGKDLRVLPKTVIYDPRLTASLPVGMSVVSGMNAIAHAAEGLYARDGNPVMSLMAVEGIRALAGGLLGLTNDGADVDSRAQCLYGAWLCGTVLGHVGMALHHKLCHTLGGSFNLPHAETHTIVLPHALAYNAPAAPEAMEKIGAAIHVTDAPLGIQRLAQRLGAPTSLKDIGLKESDLDHACDIALSNPYWNPRPIERQPIRALLQRAWEGAAPQA